MCCETPPAECKKSFGFGWNRVSMILRSQGVNSFSTKGALILVVLCLGGTKAHCEGPGADDVNEVFGRFRHSKALYGPWQE